MVVADETTAIGVALEGQVIEAAANNHLLCLHGVEHHVRLDDKVVHIAEQAVGRLVQQGYLADGCGAGCYEQYCSRQNSLHSRLLKNVCQFKIIFKIKIPPPPHVARGRAVEV